MNAQYLAEFSTNKCVVTEKMRLFKTPLRMTCQYRLRATYKHNRKQIAATVLVAAFPLLENIKMGI
jgi:hypothetical protein